MRQLSELSPMQPSGGGAPALGSAVKEALVPTTTFPRSVVLDLDPAADYDSVLVTGPIRVLIAAAQPIVLTGLRAVLTRDPGIRILGEAKSEFEVIEKTVALDPDVLVMDFDIGGMKRLDLLREIRGRANRCKTLLFAPFELKDHFVEAVRIGCSGILLKENCTAVIAQSIRAIKKGSMWLDLGTTAAVVREFAASADLPSIRIKRKTNVTVSSLTKQERDLILLVGMGYNNKEIARHTSRSQQTVKNKLHSLCERLGVSDRLALVLYAISTRIVRVSN